jgi:hypothetical protein
LEIGKKEMRGRVQETIERRLLANSGNMVLIANNLNKSNMRMQPTPDSTVIFFVRQWPARLTLIVGLGVCEQEFFEFSKCWCEGGYGFGKCRIFPIRGTPGR